VCVGNGKSGINTRQHISLDFEIMDCMDNIMDQIPTEIHEKLVAGGYVDLAQLPHTDTNIARWDRVKADCGLSGDELSRLMMILCIPSDIRGKLAKAGIVKRAHLPNDESMDRWDRVQTHCGLSVGEITELMNIHFPVGK
jgi:hypothetical protein